MGKEKVMVIEIDDQFLSVTLFNQEGGVFYCAQKFFELKNHPDYGLVIDPQEIIYLVRSCVNDVLVTCKKQIQISHIGIVGKMNSILFCNQTTGVSLTPAFHLMDGRCGTLIKKLRRTQLAQDYLDITNQPISSYSFFAHLKWFIDYGIDSFPINIGSSYCLTLESFLLLNLTGLVGVKWDVVTAAMTGLFDSEQQTLSSIICADLKLSIKNFPKLSLPFDIGLKTKGFVPLADDISISFMVNYSSLHWFSRRDSSFGDTTVVLEKDKMSIQKNYFDSAVSFSPEFSTGLFYKNAAVVKLLYKDLIIPKLPAQFLSRSFEDIMKSKGTYQSFKNWFLLHSDLVFGELQFTFVNRESFMDDFIIDETVLAGLFYKIKMQLDLIEEKTLNTCQDLWCYSTFDVDESRWIQLANSLQHTLTIVGQEYCMDSMIRYFLLTSGMQFSKALKIRAKTIMPEQDPISSYAAYQEWFQYYLKLYKTV